LTRNTRFLVYLFVLVLLVGCGANGGEDAASPTPEPVSATPFDSPLQPTPTPVSSCLELIEPVGNTICGFIISQINGEPVTGRPVYLAEALFSTDNSNIFSALDQSSAPQGVTDESGMFYVTDVPPNMYFLMIDDFPQPIMLKERDIPENDLYVDWREEGGVVDLGIILVGLVDTNP
jgi:hypothetical protein